MRSRKEYWLLLSGGKDRRVPTCIVTTVHTRHHTGCHEPLWTELTWYYWCQNYIFLWLNYEYVKCFYFQIFHLPSIMFCNYIFSPVHVIDWFHVIKSEFWQRQPVPGMTSPGEGFSQGEERSKDQEELREREPDPPGGREEEGDHVVRLEESISQWWEVRRIY